MDTSTKIILVLLVAITIFIIVSFTYLLVANPQTLQLNNIYKPVRTPIIPYGPGYACNDDTFCKDGLTCDQSLRQCKLKDGKLCTTGPQCKIGSYCSGVCFSSEDTPSNYDKGGIGSPCPCDNDSACVGQVGDEDKKICLLLPGKTCVDDGQCISNLCTLTCNDGSSCTSARDCSSGACTKKCNNTLIIGSSCTSSDQCSSDNCQNGYCQYPNLTNGQDGAYCNSSISALKCSGALSCSTNSICTDTNSKYYEFCSIFTGCADIFNCYKIPTYSSSDSSINYNNNLKKCDDEDTSGYNQFCQCLTPFNINPLSPTVIPTPNTPSDSGGCGDGFIPNSTTTACEGVNGMPCESDGVCSDKCSGQSTLFRLDPFLDPGVDVDDNPIYWVDVVDDDDDEEDLEASIPYNSRVYPNNGVYGMTKVRYTPLVNLTNPIITKLFGYTLNFQYRIDGNGSNVPSFKDMTSNEVIYGLGNNGLVYRYSSGSFIVQTLLIPGFTGVIKQIVDIDALCYGTDVNIIMAAIITDNSGGVDTLKLFSLDDSKSGTLTASTYSYQLPSSEINLIRLTIAKKNGDILRILTVTTSGSGFKNVKINDDKNASIDVKLNASPINKSKAGEPFYETATLTYGIDTNDDGGGLRAVFYYVLYKVNVNNNTGSLAIFSSPLFGKTPRNLNYTGITYPVDLYTKPGNVYNVNAFVTNNASPEYTKYQNLLLSASISFQIGSTLPYLYYISDGVSYNISGYMGEDTLYLMTPGFLYIYSQKTCSS
jgi:hypothetical protein